MSEYSDLAGKRDYRTPLHLTGKPYKKTYWDWLRHRWRTDVCILLGVREVAPSVPRGNRTNETDRTYKSYSSHESHRSLPKPSPKPTPQSGPEPGSLRDRIHRHLRKHGASTTAEIIAAVQWPNQRSVAAAINHDPLIVQAGGPVGKGRGMGGQKARWALRESAVAHD